MLSDSSQVKYHWLADGTKYRVADASGNGVIYAGDLTFTVAVSGGNTTYALESAEASVDGTARFLKNGTAMTPYYTIRDHIGSVRTIVNASGSVVERNDYYPFGSRTTFGASYATLSSNRQKFSGKEDQTTVAGSTLPYLDIGARMYDAKLVRWNTYDLMAEKYYEINPYVYCAGDPVNNIDPFGCDIIIRGANQSSVMIFTPDIEKDYNWSKINFKGNYFFEGLESATTFFDLIGIADPTGLSDAMSFLLYSYQGDIGSALLSAVALVPYLGDAPKLRHIDEYIELYNVTTHSHHIIPKAVYKYMDELWDVMGRDSKYNRVELPAGFHGNHKELRTLEEKEH